MNPTVSIVVVNYNTCRMTIDCLTSVYRHTTGLAFDVIVVDNASTDGSVPEIRQTFPAVRIIENPRNLGFGPANNIGIRASSAPFVFLLNSDTLLRNNAVGMFTDFMSHPDNATVACCGGQLVNPDGSVQASYGNFPSLPQVLFDQFELRRVMRRWYQRRLAVAVDLPPAPGKGVPYISGADLFVRRSALDTVGLFDERFFLYFEETDLCWRFYRAGYRCELVPQAAITHLFGGSSRGFSLQRMRHFKRSELLFFEKNRGKMTRLFVKVAYIKGYALRWLLTRNSYYRDLLRIVIES